MRLDSFGFNVLDNQKKVLRNSNNSADKLKVNLEFGGVFKVGYSDGYNNLSGVGFFRILDCFGRFSSQY
jgi:hypothetical protein